uniref:MINDY deubiquitinase domain-containing protein n=1 Tax=Solanum tuberosum TaxID=4113 RepID=M1C2T5_SOLTU
MDSSIPTSQSEERKPEEPETKEMVHKTKVIQFLGRTTPIILQNDNGPCPLLAICNVLLLKNNLSLSPDIPEVSQEKLLSLVAERLIDSNSNVNDKDVGYVENQQQNIADAIDLLPRLATGIDVNIKFRRIDDFEFTRECAIFDLLDIPLYHGWIVDPQDHDTENAIGSKSYNTLMGELVSLDTQNMETEHKKSSEDDDVDFAAATTAALGVPSPCLSRGRSFDDSPVTITDRHAARKGDIEEEAELLKALQLSEAETATSSVETDGLNSLGEIANLKCPEPVVLNKTSEVNAIETQPVLQHEALISTEELVANISKISGDGSPNSSQLASEVAVSSSLKCDQETPTLDLGNAKLLAENESLPLESGQISLSACENHEHLSGGMNDIPGTIVIAEDGNAAEPNQVGCDVFDSSSSSIPSAAPDSSGGRQHDTDEAETFNSSIDGDEPMYEGEDCILESATTSYQSREPMYEGEVILAEQVNGDSRDVPEIIVKDEITQKEGELVRNFLKNSASQLTIFGLFSLQEGLKERELCVFFRNNHFNTMFKFEGELYILATDQGFINQPDLVWEKFNEVNGNTIYVTSNFKEFKVEDNANTTWDQQSAMDSTAHQSNPIICRLKLFASVEVADTWRETVIFSDLQLAIALQQQEFEQQQQQAPQRNQNPQQPAANGGSRLITGPQVPRTSARPMSSSPRPDPKSSKDKCIVM